MSTNLINKLSYLKRYNNNLPEKKRDDRNKIKKITYTLHKSKGLRILDDDADLNLPFFTPENNGSEDDSDDEKPFLAEFIDERPNEIKQLEKFRHNGKWKLLNTEIVTETHSNQFTSARHDSDTDSELQQKSNVKGQNCIEDDDFNLSLQNDRQRSLDSGSDLSPPRKIQSEDSYLSPIRKTINIKHNSECDLSPPRQSHRKINEVIYRDKTGKKRNIVEEQRQKQIEDKKKKVASAKYRDWNKGLKQKEMQTAQVEYLIDEINKPLARYQNDKDLDGRLRQIDREGDPMLEFLKKKQKKKPGREKPQYKGPEPSPNRFSMQPGYRWDGVDRSNGFERQYFFRLSEKKALKDMAYKWSVEDM